MALRRSLLCFLLGGMMVLSFAPFEQFWLAPLCIAGLAYLLLELTPRQAFGAGFAFGMGQYLGGVSWVHVSISVYGGMPLWMSSIAVLGFSSLVAVFIAVSSLLVASCCRPGCTKRLAIFPFAWLVSEWMKSWVLTGFPWLDVGYTQTPSWLMAWAPVGGLYAVSLAVLIVSASLVALLKTRSLFAGGLIIAVLLSSWVLDQQQWTQPFNLPIEVRVVQGNVAIKTKWQAQQRNETIQIYQSLSQSTDIAAADLIVWPETALALAKQQVDKQFWRAMAPEGATLITGLIDDEEDRSYNAAVMRCGDQLLTYRKRHLVPFGEYLPLRFLFGWVFDYLQLPMSGFSSWQGEQPLACNDVRIGLSICYEDAFSGEYRAHVGDATMLVNISEDAWFGDSLAPHQRRQMAQMRAAELGRPMVRSANSGPSLFIDERGQVQYETEQFKTLYYQQAVQPMTGQTPFMRIGNWPLWLSCFVVGVMLFRRFVQKR